MRIGLITEEDAGAQSGLAASVDAIVAQRPRDSSVHHYAVPSKNLSALLRTQHLAMRVAGDRIDVVHVATTGPLALVALLLASRAGLPVVGSFQPPSPTASRLRHLYLRTLVRHVRRQLVTSLTGRQACIRAGMSPSKIIVWQPGVDCAMFAPSQRSAALREWWGVSDALPAIIYAGALSDERGVQRLLSFEVALRRTRPMHRLIVAGDGPSRHQMQARCPNAVFLGAVPRAQMPEILASADLFLCPNEASSTNLAVLEAQASGLPVVVMERGSARERVTEATAIVCRSQADFIVETAALVRTNARRTAMGLAARAYATRQEWAAGLTSVYTEYRAAAAISRVRGDLEPAFIPQGRRL